MNSKGELKIIDFGLAKYYGSPNKAYSTGVVTRHYRSPELLFGAKYYGPAIDMWSLGCILGELLLRNTMFPGSTDID
jgi:serine/threonine protein kinase